MKVLLKNINFNTNKPDIIDFICNDIKDEYSNILHLICLKIKEGLECEIEIMGENIYINKTITKKNNEYISFILADKSNPIIIKLLVVNHTSKLIYIGEYIYKTLTYDINTSKNITNTIIKIKNVDDVDDVDDTPTEGNDGGDGGNDIDDDDDEDDEDDEDEDEDGNGEDDEDDEEDDVGDNPTEGDDEDDGNNHDSDDVSEYEDIEDIEDSNDVEKVDSTVEYLKLLTEEDNIYRV